MADYIVVTEGLIAPETATASSSNLSDYFEAVLRQVAMDSQKSDRIFISPGNSFNHPKYEEEYAAEFLQAIRPDLQVLVPKNVRDLPYLDTFDNARLLQKWLKQRNYWPLKQVILYCNYPHSFRSWMMFICSGFSVKKVVGCRPQQVSRIIAPRLWFYNYPPIQFVYELTSLVYNTSRLVIWKVKGSL